ncbi:MULTISPECIES: CBS domain-containing protein [Metallosphaera]|uniref:Histidine kinase n=3 Tax=Metallosphaera TaxID=41980 RepID=A0A088E1Y4_9CREN|nr:MULTISPECIES: CBS domain-containing protein [Metallosphaera]ABP94457.1 putative signal-transduction protein with CBS domains [Metallosphaera sedula DSM 5348]AIM26444.1 putative signal-transduction protein with CBS domains [Metallosphaera sedula]AKV73445.1 histidine kinase [Metallosphaera sedula]AKV75688.1 histidine kinase [Metallosphaera sedula]AKV77934.1 histidine kinase [Metallosphaera sedula]
MASIVKHLISKNPVSVERGTPVIKAVELMASHNMGSVIITKDGKLAGIITERDVIRGIARGISLNQPVEEFGTMKDLVTVREDDTVYTAVKKMAERNLRHLIVVDRDGNLKGVISVRDIIRESHVLKAISQVEGEEFPGSD